ncbi:PREDICTED: uncharacterized protein LOC108691676 isoform X2 [Atta colombica]|uniref:uncharacterized protein LOC108691676 isoform X2 n=1 Tax=Atta colombica TaxID=520822 RepID=UPI00084C6D14|nr:PREDICTED: uncharacterized protein LOC108691676 isoform X2 [Atta colombica]
MVRYCILCCNHDKTVSYHKFPKDMHIRKKWLEFCNFGENFAVKTSTYLCSKHFTEKDYLLTATNRILMSGSIPSIYHVKKRKSNQNYNSKVEIAKCYKNEYMVNMCQEESCSTMINVCEKEPSCSTVINVCKEEPSYSTIIVDKNTDELILKEEKIDHNIDGMSPMDFTHPNSPHEPRYIGDIRISHLATPQKAERALNLAKFTVKKQRRKILTLQQTTTRLRKRIKTMKTLIDHLKKRMLYQMMLLID